MTEQTAPAPAVGLTVAVLPAAAVNAPGPVGLLTTGPMLVIAGSCHRLRLGNAYFGVLFAWVGRAVNSCCGIEDAATT